MAVILGSGRVQASAAKTTTGNGSAVLLESYAREIIFFLDVTAAATDNVDTLDVFVQTKIGDNWVDVVHFTQVLGNGGAKQFCSKIINGLAQAEFDVSAALAAPGVRHLVGDEWRTRWVIVDADADATFTFAVTAHPRS